ncbi:hypothetical protein FGO68_gene10911 [Halteria grandinella]|uniref:Uncharacterized protein n=1 Tax=Halteria grandinella TaxID=5974 RepID=A0A8J8TAD0_HALGN|nr:hypothetical protein FGO68_gene10911 [Halteria grandinella]
MPIQVTSQLQLLQTDIASQNCGLVESAKKGVNQQRQLTINQYLSVLVSLLVVPSPSFILFLRSDGREIARALGLIAKLELDGKYQENDQIRALSVCHQARRFSLPKRSLLVCLFQSDQL